MQFANNYTFIECILSHQHLHSFTNILRLPNDLTEWGERNTLNISYSYPGKVTALSSLDQASD